MSAKPFKRHNSEVILETPIFKVRRDRSSHPHTGQEGDYFVLEQPGWVNVVALTDGAEALVMVRQWRHGTRSIELEIPAGLIDPGEGALEAAARELREETGYVAKRLEIIGDMQPNPAFQSNSCHVVLATGCRRVGEQALDHDEQIEVVSVPASELEEYVRSGEIRHGIVLFALYTWLNHQGMVRWPGG